MRTIKASEVRKGMRVQFDVDREGVTYTITSSVTGTTFIGSARTDIPLGTGGRVIETLPNDHPVTVLAEPEPEWVEGAWYWTQTASQTTPRIRKRMECGWASVGVDGTSTLWLDNGAADFSVLGRVLIVDWPGDDVARDIERTYTPGGKWIAVGNTATQIIADAIRTQGGAR